MSMPLARRFTADAVRAFPDDGNRYETVYGELRVTPAPRGRHQPIVTRLMLSLGHYLASHDIEGLLTSPADISFGNDTLVQPDLFVAAQAAFIQSGNWADIRILYLVIEILSPSTVRTDRFTKRRLYQEQNIPTYWIIDIENRQCEVWTPDATVPVVERNELRWRHPAAPAECRIDLVKLFTL